MNTSQIVAFADENRVEALRALLEAFGAFDRRIGF